MHPFLPTFSHLRHRSAGLLLTPTLLALAVPLALAEDAAPPAPKPVPAPAAAPADAQPATAGAALTVSGEKEDAFAVGRSGSATKLDVPDQQNPQSMTQLPRELLTAQGAYSLRDALRSAPGVTMASGEGGRTGDSLTIRGYTANSDLYTDGLKDNGQYFRDTFATDHIEVLRGASAMLFGRGATGGAINTVTRKPTDQWTGDAAVTAGQYDFLRDSVGIGGPVVDDALGVRLDAFRQESDSFRDQQHLEREGVAPSVALTLPTQTKVLVQYLHQREDSTMDYGVPIVNGRPADVPVRTYYGFKDDSFQHYRVDQFTGTVEQPIDEHLTLRNAFRYSDYYRAYRTEILGAFNAGTGNVARTQALRDNDQHNLQNQTELAAKGKVLGHDATLVVGGEIGNEYFRFRSRNSTVAGSPSGTVQPVNVQNPQSPATVGAGRADTLDGGVLDNLNSTHADSYAGYALGTFDVTEQWKVVLGGRFDTFGANFSSGPTVTAPARVELEHTDRVFSPRGGLVWTPIPEVSAYASYSTSFNPSAETFSLSNGSTGTVDLSPEKNVNYEVGVKAALLDKKLNVDVAVFRLDKTNARTTDTLANTVSVDGEQRTDGIELGLNGAITHRWSVYGGIAWYDAEVVKSNTFGTPAGGAVNSVAVQGKVPVNAPDLSGSLWTGYDLGLGFTISGGVSAVSRRYANTINTVIIPGYARVDAALSYTHSWHDTEYFAQLNVQNLLNTTYYDTANSTFAAPGAPIGGQLTVGARF